MAVMCLTMATVYTTFGLAEIQPWAADNPVELNQQNTGKNKDFSSV